VLELLAPPIIEAEIQRRVEARVREADSVSVEIDSFPVVPTVLSTAGVRRLVVTLDGVDGDEVDITRLSVELEGPALERSALLDGEAALDKVDRAVLTAEIDEADVADALTPLGVSVVDLTPGGVRVTANGVTVDAQVTVADGVLRVSADGVGSLDVPLPRTDLFPCDPSGEVLADRVRVSCSINTVPEWLVKQATT
jgi:hypothetical protein